jgi:hypothetical protein
MCLRKGSSACAPMSVVSKKICQRKEGNNKLFSILSGSTQKHRFCEGHKGAAGSGIPMAIAWIVLMDSPNVDH